MLKKLKNRKRNFYLQKKINFKSFPKKKNVWKRPFFLLNTSLPFIKKYLILNYFDLVNLKNQKRKIRIRVKKYRKNENIKKREKIKIGKLFKFFLKKKTYIHTYKYPSFPLKNI